MCSLNNYPYTSHKWSWIFRELIQTFSLWLVTITFEILLKLHDIFPSYDEFCNFFINSIIVLWQTSEINYTVIKFLQNCHKNHLNLTINYTVYVANCCKHWFYLIFYIEMFSGNHMKFQDFSFSTQFMLTHTRYLIYILIH